MLEKKSDEKQILSNNKNKALINNLTDQIEFLKNELRSKDTIIKQIIKNSKYDKYSSHQKKPAKLKTSDNRILTTFCPSTVLKH